MKAIRYLFTFKYFKYSMIGHTLPKIVAFLFLYYMIYIMYKGILFKDEEAQKLFCTSAKNWSAKHVRLYFIFSFLLGFYTSVVMNRWWNQIKAMPNKECIPKIVMVLNATVLPGNI